MFNIAGLNRILRCDESDISPNVWKPHVHECLALRAHAHSSLYKMRHLVDSISKLLPSALVQSPVLQTHASPVNVLKAKVQICVANWEREANSLWLLCSIVINDIRNKSPSILLCICRAQYCVPVGHEQQKECRRCPCFVTPGMIEAEVTGAVDMKQPDITSLNSPCPLTGWVVE